VFRTRLTADALDRIQDRVRSRLAADGFDALLTDSPEDVAYLTGFFHHPSERPVAVWMNAEGRTVLLVPELERENAERQSARAELVSYPEFPGVLPPFRALADRVGRAGRVGFSTGMTWERQAAAFAELDAGEAVATPLLTVARYVKLPEEVALHAEAARITDLMLESGVALIRERVSAGGELPSEAELASHVGGVGVSTMYAEHDDVVVVSPLAGGLVYAGANSAYPHGLPSGYRLRPGDTFMLSLGCAVGGRFVEGERTFLLGEPSEEQRLYYEVVREAQQTGTEAILAGARCADVNRTCLDVIRKAGLERYLRHRQGHGIGLGMHEPPWLEDGDDTVLEPGMIVSSEPGLYIPGHAGYRISDSVLVTENGPRPFTSYPRSLEDAVIPL
jgi:Xaa-Pro aminopeptidase